MKRLGKQRSETFQIYKALTVPDYRWKNHPIVKMWKGYENALLKYGMEICLEWRRRGYKDIMYLRFLAELYCRNFDIKYPKWLGNKDFHAGMRSNLLRKNYKYYSQFGWTEPNNLPYVWLKEK